jgi:hypothetical protein
MAGTTKDRRNRPAGKRPPSIAQQADPFSRAAIAEVIQTMKEKLKTAEFKPTLAEFIRLVQLDREMATEEPLKEIKVTWSEQKTASEPEP